MSAQPFEFHTPTATLKDLRRRLADTRWPDQIGQPWQYGSDLLYMRELIKYWRESFDWPRQETLLNELPHFYTRVDGFGLHFIHVRGRGSRPMPIILCHGWPSSFLEMLKLIPLLSDPARYGGDAGDAFDVIVPSLPGCGYSQRPTEPGMTKTRMAALFVKLMSETLGYARFAARGGDIGSGIAALMALDFPQHLIGIHVSDVIRPYLGTDAAPLSKAETYYLQTEAQWMQAEGAYDHIQATKPQTLAYGLNDSPVGLAAWIIEKFRRWSNCHGDIESRFSRDELLSNITLYWITQSIHSANRLYYERDHFPRRLHAHEYIETPCAVSLWPADIDHPPREYAERIYNIQRWTEMPRGGHFAAMEEPELLAKDLRVFFKEYR